MGPGFPHGTKVRGLKAHGTASAKLRVFNSVWRLPSLNAAITRGTCRSVIRLSHRAPCGRVRDCRT